MNPWLAFGIGALAGAITGIFVLALCVTAKRADRGMGCG